MIIGFDFDGTLNDPDFSNFLRNISHCLNQHNLVIITSRGEINDEVREVAKKTGLNFSDMIAMGNTVHLHKADFIREQNIELDLFFDNDPYDVEAFRKNGILCLFIPPKEDTLMEEICEEFVLEKCREMDRISRKRDSISWMNDSD